MAGAIVVEITTEGCAKVNARLPPGPACEERAPGFAGSVRIAVVSPFVLSQLRFRCFDDFVACGPRKRRWCGASSTWLPTGSTSNLTPNPHPSNSVWSGDAIHTEVIRTLVGFHGGNGVCAPISLPPN